jgi:hypothetical protein
MRLRLIAVLIFVLFTPLLLPAQWSTNPAINLTICDTTGEQVLPKIARTTDGGCYIGWFDSRSSGYAVYLQKLDINGNKLFPPNGLLISNNPQSTSLVDWDLAVDDSNCCVLAFTDTRAGSSINPYAYRISPSGQFLWGANGIALTDSVTVYQANPKVIVTSDGNFVIPWQYNNKIAMQKITKAGTKPWGSVPIMAIGNPSINEKFNYPTGVQSDAGSIILYWIGYTGSFISPGNYKLYTQKYSSAGTGLWGTPQDTIWNLGNAQGFYQPSVYSDGNNGAVYVWQSFLTGPTVCYVQRKNSAGQIQFPVNGSAVTTTGATMLNFAPSASYMPSTGETYVFWQRKNSLQSLIGVYGQKFSPNGTRLWADSGAVFKSLDQNSFASLNVITRDSNVYVYYAEILSGSTNGLIKAFKSDRNGVIGWGGSILTPGSYTGEKGRMTVTMNTAGMSMLAFSDSRIDAYGMYAQNINPNGSFGPPVGITPIGNIIPSKFELEQNYPNPFNPVTKIKFSITALSFPNAPIGNPATVLRVYDILGREIRTLVNENLQPGTYEVTFDAGNISSGIYFYKLSSGVFSDIKRMLLVK